MADEQTDSKTEKHKMMAMLSQAEAGYTTVSPQDGKMCANCRWFIPAGAYDPYIDGQALEARCHLVDWYPEPILPTGYSNRWEAKPNAVQTGVQPMAVVVYDQSDIDPETGLVEVERELKQPGVAERFMNLLREAIRQPEPINTFKSLSDKYWVAFYSNNFEDRQKEILTEAAHDRYIRRLKAGLVPMPVLRYRHIPGTEHGQALWIDRIENFMVAVGEYSDDALGHAFSKHYQTTRKRYKNSHGFVANPEKDYVEVDGVGYWKDYNTFEITVSPPHVVANAYTSFDEVNDMPITPQSIAELEAIVGKEKAKEIIDEAGTRSAQLKELGTRYKDFTDPQAAATPTPEQTGVEVVTKNGGELLTDLAESQTAIVKILTASEKRQTAAETVNAGTVKRLETVEKELSDLKALVSLSPRRAAQASETQVDDSAATIAKELLPENGKQDNFWS